MELNADFSKRAAMHGRELAWLASPIPGVERRLLDRIGDEVARATSIVRYAPNSSFSPHVHDGGEEFLVLDGVFEDEHGAYPAGSYVRNPPTSRHTPGSAPGCTIFVKLWQFDPEDRATLRIDAYGQTSRPLHPGVTAAKLYRDRGEEVRIERWEAETQLAFEARGGLEVLVLEGSFEEGGETFQKDSWLRLPQGMALKAQAGPKGARLWVKEGHLARTIPLPAAAR